MGPKTSRKRAPKRGSGRAAPTPRIERLRTRSQFLLVRTGAKAVRPSLLLEARRRPPSASGAGPAPIGIGFTATKKIGDAVARNRARRRLREAARQLLPRHGLAGVDYVLVARAGTLTAPWASLLDDLGKALLSVRDEVRP
ncbi:MAG: ribonuclease P protein component [Hyphomonadaceae bacterium]|nr:ribonuclease P protein component [Hyphomonadaceae bacterium]